MSNYKLLKGNAIQQAIEWQSSWQDNQYSYDELLEWQSHFYKLAKRYGLIKEFKENGIL